MQRYLTLPLATLVLCLCLGPSTAGAQTFTSDAPRVQTTVRTASVSVDGVLDEAEWQLVEAATDFVNFRPTEGAQPSQRTEARVLYGDNAVYVGATMYDTEPSQIRSILTRRDGTEGADAFLVAFDSYNDRKTAYLFGVTAAGVQFDGTVVGSGDDDSWDAVWTSAVQITADGWVAEFAIPYSQLRFAEGETTWGLQFKRDIRRTGEESFWAPLTSDEMNSGIVQLFGRLEGLQDIAPRRAIQVTPYTVARANRFENPNQPGAATADYDADIGGDLRFGISSNVTLDATINPDFGQVEADPAELNLTTFETFFPERRPFFLEGTQIFDFTYGSGDGALLYTRRVGGRAPIVGAAKVSGRLSSGTSFGVLGATTGNDFDPQRWYGATRVKREFGDQNYIGAAATGFVFNPASGAGISSVAAGVDWDMRVGSEARWKFEGTLSGSSRTIDDAGLSDPTKRGYALYLGFDQVRGYFTPGSGFRIYSPDFAVNDVGRFRQTNLIQARLGANQVWKKGDSFGPFIRAQTGGFSDQTWSYDDGTNRGAAINIFSSGLLTNFWDVNLFTSLSDIGGFDIRETRGLGPIVNFLNGGFNLDVETDNRKRFTLNPEFGMWFGEDGARTLSGELDAEWNASDRVELSAGVELEGVRNAVRWTANESLIDQAGQLSIGTTTTSPDNLTEADLLALPNVDAAALLSGITPSDHQLSIPGATSYYLPVFGERDTRNFSFTTRANVIFTPKLSLQLYGQLFAARGQYSNFQLLASSDDLRDFDYPKRADFAFQALQANVVLRWEYRPGSTLFLVWTQSRNMSEAERLLVDGSPLPRSPFDQSTSDQLRDTFDIFPNNAFLIKLNYLILR